MADYIHEDNSRAEMLCELIQGNGYMRDEDVLCMLLCETSVLRPCMETARELLARYDSLADICEQPWQELASVTGVGHRGAMILKGCLAAVPNIVSKGVASRKTVLTYSDMVTAFKPFFTTADTEKMYVMLLDEKFKLITVKMASLGGKKRLEFNPKNIVADAVRYKAGHVALAHCHVVGDLPSAGDIIETVKLEFVLETLDIKFVDHIVFTNNGVVSLRNDGYLENVRKKLLRTMNISSKED